MVIALILLVLGTVIGVSVSAGRRTPQAVMPPDTPEDELSASELAEVDPVEALLRYGTPGDAARLEEQGVDLGGLGYRSPHDE